MKLTRRHFLGSALSMGCAASLACAATAEELVPIFESEAQEVPYKFRRQAVTYKTHELAGTIVVDPRKRWLYHVHGQGKATRYGVGVGADGKNWAGEAVIKRKVEWPKWKPTKEHLAAYPS